MSDTTFAKMLAAEMTAQEALETIDDLMARGQQTIEMGEPDSCLGAAILRRRLGARRFWLINWAIWSGTIWLDSAHSIDIEAEETLGNTIHALLNDEDARVQDRMQEHLRLHGVYPEHPISSPTLLSDARAALERAMA